MTVATELADAEIEQELALETRVARRGLGYRGVFHGGIGLHLARLHSSRGELSGMLSVSRDTRALYKGRFNVSSVTSRSTLSRYLQNRDSGYTGWGVVLEKFCWHVLTIDEEGPSTAILGRQPRRAAPAYQLHPLMPRDASTILYGPGGAFKSTLAAGIAVSVQSGIPLLSGWMPSQGNVLVLDWEAGEDEWNDRIVGIAEGKGIEPPPIQYRRCSKRLVDMTEQLADQVAGEDVALLVVDSVGLAQGSSSDGGDANEATLRLFDALRAIGTTSLLIDHVRGDELGNAKASTKPYGSTYKVNLARSVFELRREEQPSFPEATQLLLRQTKVNDCAPLKPIGLQVVHGENAILFEHHAIDAPDLEQHSGTSADRMRRLLRSGAMEEGEIAEELGISASTVRSVLRRQPATFTRVGNRVGLVVVQ
jgi:hypothetical protein